MATHPNPLDGLMPRDPLMRAAWLGSLRYALGQPEVVAAFREDTGNTWTPGATPLDRLVDRATRAEADFIRSFAKWHNETIWGETDGRPDDATH